MGRPRVAVIGAGISGLGACRALQDVADVVLFEASERLGGHTDTRAVTTFDGEVTADMGFIVFNPVTYPLLTRWFEELDVPTRSTDMSFGVDCRACGIAYSGLGARGLLASVPAAAWPRHLRTLWAVARFPRAARRGRSGNGAEQVLADLATGTDPTGWFERHYLGPLAAALWSTGVPDARTFPVRTLLEFFEAHRLLGLRRRLQWRTVTGGSRAYVDAALPALASEVRTGTRVHSIRRRAGGVTVEAEALPAERFDHVIVATHADQALRLLAEPTREEERWLGAWSYTESEAWLHSDSDWLPEATPARASWIYQLEDCADPGDLPTMTYNLNRLQEPPTRQPVLVTLNPAREPRDAHAVRSFRHPLFTRRSVESQSEIRRLGDETRTYFCGAYLGFGFHEDGFRSGVAAARRVGGRFP